VRFLPPFFLHFPFPRPRLDSARVPEIGGGRFTAAAPLAGSDRGLRSPGYAGPAVDRACSVGLFGARIWSAPSRAPPLPFAEVVVTGAARVGFEPMHLFGFVSQMNYLGGF
jgi:hypothetical protein